MSNDKLSDTASNLTSKVTENARIRSILSMDVQWIDRVISIVLLLLVTVLLFETRRYPWEAQRTPIFVFGALLVLLAVELLLEFEVIGSRDYEEQQEELIEEIKEQSDVDERPVFTRRGEILKTVIWIGVLYGLVYVLGLLLGSLVFLLIFYATEARVGLIRTVTFSGVIFLFVWVVFEVLLKARLYPGIFGIGEIFYVTGSLL